MANQHPSQQKPHPEQGEDLASKQGEDLARKHLLAQPPGPSPQPNPESAPGGDHVGGDMTTAPFTGAPIRNKAASHK